MDELIELNELTLVLQEYAQEVRNTYQDNLIRSDRIASGDLLNSVEFNVEKNGNVYEVSLQLQDYWKYIEKGTRPHWPPVSKILQWIQVKPILPRPGKNGQIPTPQQLAYLISRKIAKNGTKGSADLERAKSSVMDTYRARIEIALGHDLESYIAKVLP